MSSSSQAKSDTVAERPLAVRILLEWGLPIVIGALIGLAFLYGRTLLESEACRIAKQWQWGEYELEDELTQKLVDLGDGARKDLRECFLTLDGKEVPERLIWLGTVLGGEPYFDSRFLVEQARSGETWPSRAAAVALVRLQKGKVDATVALPPIMDWLADLPAVTHEDAISAAGLLLGEGLVPADRLIPLRDALIVLSDRAGRNLPGVGSGNDDGDPDIADRTAAVRELGQLLDDELVIGHLKAVAGDEEEYTEPRVMALRMLSERGPKSRQELIWETAFWTRAGRSTNPVVRDTVAANSFRSTSPDLNEVLLELHSDASLEVRTASISSQRKRGFATPIAVIHELLEDPDQWVRREAILAVLTFKDQPDPGARVGHVLRLLGESDVDSDVSAAFVTLFGITKQAHGVRETDVSLLKEEVDEKALAAFMNDPALRTSAVAAYAKHFGGTAVFTNDDLRAVWTKMLEHADPGVVEHAKQKLSQ